MTTDTRQTAATRTEALADNSSMFRINVIALGWSISLFFVISYILCIALGLVVPDWEMHKPWLQFFPGFQWLTLKGVLIGLAEAFVYGWYVGLIFGPLYNYFASRR